jgi:hypothetical protein
MDEGWTRYVFDTFNVPYESLRDAAMREGNLRARFDVIVLPSERARGNMQTEDNPFDSGASGLNAAGAESVRRFANEGGTLICFDAACETVIKQFNLLLRNVLEGLRSSDFYCPGSILRITVNTSDPISRTMSKDVDAYFINSSAFEIKAGGESRVRVVARYADKDVLRSGWLLGEKYLAGKIALAEVSLGKGRVVLFGFRPQHRGQTWGTFPFIWNSIMSSD